MYPSVSIEQIKKKCKDGKESSAISLRTTARGVACQPLVVNSISLLVCYSGMEWCTMLEVPVLYLHGIVIYENLKIAYKR